MQYECLEFHQGQHMEETFIPKIMRSMNQNNPNPVIQQNQHGSEHKGQAVRENLYQQGEQKVQKYHYQLSDQKSQQLHLASRPVYLHAGQDKSQQHYTTSGRQHGEPKSQAMSESPRYIHSEQKKIPHDSPRVVQQHKEQNNQQKPESPSIHHSSEQQKKQHESPCSNDQKNQQKNVHKFHHGNARVKYVEYKPIPEGVKYRQIVHPPQHSYANSKQMLYYSNHVPNKPGSHHLTVQTQSHPHMSPLHSPPALRPPPTIPSGTAWHSPPSLVPSPDVRPRFDFISSPQPITTAGSPHHLQVGNMVHHKTYTTVKGGKQISIPASGHNIIVPGGHYIASPGQEAHSGVAQHLNVVSRSKANASQLSVSNSPVPQSAYINSSHGGHPQSVIPVSSVATTVTVTMTYFPMGSTSKDKGYVYVPVNSGQPLVVYQNQQQGGKAVILPQQMIQPGRNVSKLKDIKDPTYTAVRLQGPPVHGKHSLSSGAIVCTQTSPMKTFKYHFANQGLPLGSAITSKKPGFIKLEQKLPSNKNLVDRGKPDLGLGSQIIVADTKPKEMTKETISTKSPSDVMTVISNNLKLVPPHVGVNSVHNNSAIKRNHIGVSVPTSSSIAATVTSHLSVAKTSNTEQLTTTNPSNTLCVQITERDKKKGGKPPSDKVPKKVRKKEKGKGKVVQDQGNLLTVSKSNSDELLIEAYKKQQQVLLQKHYFEEPLLCLPDLPPTPETWTCDEVHKYLSSTDCAKYADAFREEEIDGKSFLMLTSDALVDFLGIKLGPALKLAGHACSLQARQRVYCLTMLQQEQKAIGSSGQKPFTSKVEQSQIDVLGSHALTSGGNSCTTAPPLKEASIKTTHCNAFSTVELAPRVSLVSASPKEKKVIPLSETLPLNESSPVILKVPNPLSLILGSNGSTEPLQTPGSTIRTPELSLEESVCATAKSDIVNSCVNESTTENNLHLNIPNISSKFEFSSSPLPSSPQVPRVAAMERDTTLTLHKNS